jgi:hypothetical protein
MKKQRGYRYCKSDNPLNVIAFGRNTIRPCDDSTYYTSFSSVKQEQLLNHNYHILKAIANRNLKSIPYNGGFKQQRVCQQHLLRVVTSWTLLQASSTVFSSLWVSSMANSSPPMRETMSPLRKERPITPEAATKNPSPASCPRVSLINFNKRRQSTIAPPLPINPWLAWGRIPTLPRYSDKLDDYPIYTKWCSQTRHGFAAC